VLVGEVGLEPTKASASGFTVRPLCRSGHSPARPKIEFGRREDTVLPVAEDKASASRRYDVASAQCQPGAALHKSATACAGSTESRRLLAIARATADESGDESSPTPRVRFDFLIASLVVVAHGIRHFY
jgi:hypothetical protein